MAYPGPVSATQVGSYFVQRYYQTLRKQPELAHQFYTDSSSMIRVDGDSIESASDLLQIHNLVSSLQFTGIEIKTINSLESWNGGVLVVVSGCIRAEYFGGKRNYVESFLLAPQDKGFFVLNDIFNFIEEDVIQPVLTESRIDSQVPASTHNQEVSGYDHNLYDYEAEASEYVNSVHINGDNQINDYSFEEQQKQLQQQQTQETYTVSEEIPAEEEFSLHESFVEHVAEPQHFVEEPIEKPQKFTYASILQASKGPPAVINNSRPFSTKSVAPPPEWQQPQTPQQPILTESTNSETAHENPSLEEEVELLKSVYVRNLPSNVTATELEQEFKIFGKIIPNGIFVRDRKEIGVCYAFVEYEDLQAVHNAIKASPLQLAGRQIYVEERRANSNGGAPRGGRLGRGRGRGSYQSDSYRGQYGGRSSSRGGYQNGGDYNRYGGNGFRS